MVASYFNSTTTQCTSITELMSLSMLASLSMQDLINIAQIMTCMEYPTGDVIIREGDPGEYFYIIVQGKIEIIKSMGTADEHLVRITQADDFFGEMSLLDSTRLHTASVRTLEPVRLLALARNDFEDLLNHRPELAYHIMRELGLRLTATENEIVKELSQKNLILAKAYEELKSAQTQIIEKERLEKELQLARQIQERLLPRNMPLLKGYDFATRMLPAEAVGGDLYDFIPLRDGNLGIVIGDVTDKGVPAALMMATTHSLIHAESTRTSSPEKCLRRVNKTLLEMNLDNMFATVVYGILQSSTGTFTYARAGHELPLCVTSSGGCKIPEYSNSHPLGIVPDPEIDVQTIQIKPGQTLLLFTDGVMDARNMEGEHFGIERLKEAVLAGPNHSADQTCERIYQALNQFQPVNKRYDDITLLAIHAKEWEIIKDF